MGCYFPRLHVHRSNHVKLSKSYNHFQIDETGFGVLKQSLKTFMGWSKTQKTCVGSCYVVGLRLYFSLTH